MMKPTSMIPRHQDSRSTSSCDLIIPKHITKFVEHTFIVASKMAWNRLPQTIHEEPSLTTFRRLLKTYLFEIAYSYCWLCTVLMRSSQFRALYKCTLAIKLKFVFACMYVCVRVCIIVFVYVHTLVICSLRTSPLI